MVNNGQFSQIREVVLNKVLRILHNNEALNEFLCWDELIDSTCCPRYINKDEMSPRQIGNSFYFKVGHVFKEICRRQSFLVSNLFQTRTSHFVWKSHKNTKSVTLFQRDVHYINLTKRSQNLSEDVTFQAMCFMIVKQHIDHCWTGYLIYFCASFICFKQFKFLLHIKACAWMKIILLIRILIYRKK